MNRAVAHLLTRLYPRRWRERYGAEFQALLEMNDSSSFTTVGAAANVMGAALRERIFLTRGHTMNQPSRTFGSMLKQPGAFVPMTMSLTALAMVLTDLAIYGVPHGGDEGAVAHLWQLLMGGQLPIIAFFAIKWMRQAPRQTFSVLSLQAGAVLAACAPVFFFNL